MGKSSKSKLAAFYEHKRQCEKRFRAVDKIKTLESYRGQSFLVLEAYTDIDDELEDIRSDVSTSCGNIRTKSTKTKRYARELLALFDFLSNSGKLNGRKIKRVEYPSEKATVAVEAPPKLGVKTVKVSTRIPQIKTLIEQAKSDILATKLNGVRESVNPCGRVDVLTSQYVIEVKEAANWKHAIGQVIVYSFYYPDRKPMLYLFGNDVTKYRKFAKQHCERLGIEYREEN